MHFSETFRRLPFGTVFIRSLSPYIYNVLYKLNKYKLYYVVCYNLINMYEDLHCHILKNLCIFFTISFGNKLLNSKARRCL